MKADLLQGFYLGDLLVEPLKGQVSGRAGSTHLPPKAVEVLLCLADSPGKLISRATLLETAWGPGGGSPESLNHAISEIRHALDDHADNPVFIQTIPRRGYRLAVAPQFAADHAASIVLGAQGGAGVDDIGLFENLQRRGVLETALAYLILGWLLIQIADIVFAQLHFPQWAGTFVTVLVIAGFPIALALSWFLEFRDGRAVIDELSPADARRRRFSRTYISIVGSLAIAGVMVYAYDAIVGLPGPDEQPAVHLPPIAENSFAVLPFLNLDGSDETQIFADGLMDDVINQLSRVPGLRVASRGDSATMAPNSASQDVRNRLRVEMYLEGSVEMNEDEMRVTVQLINSEDGFHVLSRQFDRPREDFFQVRDDITSLTVANVRVALPPDLGKLSLKLIEDPSLDAYVLYRRGLQAARQPKTIDTIASALGWFDAALNVDPEYAAAHAAKCAVYVEGYGEVDDPSYITNAESSCATALALNPNLDVVHVALGDLYRSTGKYDDAEAEYKRALSIDPNSSESFSGLGQIFVRQKRFDEAEATLQRAIEIHPGNANMYNMLGTFLYRTGRYEEAAEQYEYGVALQPENMAGHTNLGSARMLAGDFDAAARAYEQAIEIRPTMTAYSNLGLMFYYLGDLDAAIENHTNAVALQPNDHLARSNLGDALWIAGRHDDARQAFEKARALVENALQVNSSDPYSMMDMAWIQAMLDNHDAALALMDRARSIAPDDPYTHYYDALVFLRAGDKTAALESLEIAVEKGYSRQLLATEPHLHPLRGELRFVAILNSG